MSLTTSAAATKEGVESSRAVLRPHLPSTTNERLDRIKKMLERVNGHVEFICGVGAMQGSSAQAKEAAVAAFCERMAVLEQQLRRISEGLRLG